MTLSQLNVRIAQEEHDHLEALASQTVGILTKAGVVRLLIRHAMAVGWNPLDGPDTLGGPSAAGTPSTSSTLYTIEEENKTFKNNMRARELLTPRDLGENPRAKRDPYARRQLPEDAVPPELADLEDLLREFWSVKKGTRSERAWNRLCNKLRTFAPADREPALQAACNAGWADIYEPAPPRPRPGQFAAPEPAPKHPASRLFMNGRWVDEEPPVTNPLLADAF